MGIESAHRFFGEVVSELEVSITDSDQVGFCKHPKMMDDEGKKQCSSHNTKVSEGGLLRNMGLIRNR